MKKEKVETVGWYVDIPKELTERFDKLFPRKGSKRAVVLAAITRAVLHGEEYYAPQSGRNDADNAGGNSGIGDNEDTR